MTGIKTMASVASAEAPFRFIYTSGALSERDPSKSLWLNPEYRKMRGEVENWLLAYAVDTAGKVEVQVTKPGLIDHSGRIAAVRTLLSVTGLSNINVSELAAAELNQALGGFEKDTLMTPDLVRIGRDALWN
ncbi:hypothetical protein LTR37_013452 [Vermiconidia calcicola]|uniref:Uncharacterized protein n=1 Tax=Vermiconidia calcicola TaxID=1690605 RepID=A0ACC3MWC9_9PEZI|nr:hypothetical protein LTR37_013452 [Vermiconidia calcicola]